MPKEVLRVGQVILTRSSQLVLDEYGRAQYNADGVGDGLRRSFVHDVEIISNLGPHSFGGGYLRGWPGPEAMVVYPSAGTRDFEDVIAILGQLSLEEFIHAMRAWEGSIPNEEIVATYRLPHKRVELANFNPGITVANYMTYLRVS